MALDTKQKRGSAIGVSLPYRQWLAEPDGTIAATDRQSLVKFCSAVAFAAPGGNVYLLLRLQADGLALTGGHL